MNYGLYRSAASVTSLLRERAEELRGRAKVCRFKAALGDRNGHERARVLAERASLLDRMRENLERTSKGTVG